MRYGDEKMEHGKKVNENRPMMEDRHPDKMMMDSPDSIRRAGGEDPRRHDAKIAIERTVRNHDQSGYNHNGVIDRPEAAHGNNEYKAMKEREVESTPQQRPDGTVGMGPLSGSRNY